MFQSFVVMLREGIEAALVVAMILVVLKRSGRRDLERSVYVGIALAVAASVAAAVLLSVLRFDEDAYEGYLYFVSAAFVISMMWWMHCKAKTLHGDIERRVQRAVETADADGAWRESVTLGAFAFIMVFREGAEAVLLLSAIKLTTDAMLGFIGSLAGLVAALVFCVLFVRGSLQADLRRFFKVTEWVLAVFVAQLLINGYHEFAEVGILPATQKSMAVIGPMVRNNSLFILAIVAIPLFIWLSKEKEAAKPTAEISEAARRLLVAKARQDRVYRYGAIASAMFVLLVVGIVYAQEVKPRTLPLPEPVTSDGGVVSLSRSKLNDGKLHRFGFLSHGHLVRFLAIKTADGKVRTSLDACEICGSFGYVQEGQNLICLNCTAAINPLTLGQSGGCNPIPLKSQTTKTQVRVAVKDLTKSAKLFADQSGLVEIDPVCGMRVKMSKAAGFQTVKGKTYYFCSPRCLSAFKKNPAAYLK